MPRAGVGHRLLGALIMTKAALPVVLVGLLAFGAWQIASGISRAVEDARKEMEVPLELARDAIDDVQAEGRRLLKEAEKIESASTRFVGGVEQSIEPIRKAMLALQGATRGLAGSFNVISAINRLPKVDLKPVPLPNLRIPQVKLPALDIDLKPDLAAVHRFNEAAQAIGRQAQQAVDQIAEAVLFWWWTITLAAALVVLWMVLAVVCHLVRVGHRFATGWRMLLGHKVERALALL